MKPRRDPAEVIAAQSVAIAELLAFVEGIHERIATASRKHGNNGAPFEVGREAAKLAATVRESLGMTTPQRPRARR